MNREDVIAVAARLFAVYMLFDILVTVPGATQLLSGQHGTALAALYIFILGAGALFCGFLWFFPLVIARKLLPAMREPRSEQVLGAPVALSLGLTLIGAWFFATSVIDASYWLTLIIHSKEVIDGPVEWSHEQIASMVANFTRLFLSLWLLFGTAGIQRLIYKFRYGEL